MTASTFNELGQRPSEDAGFARHLDISVHAGDRVHLDDPELVFSGSYVRAGEDLVISRAFQSVTLHGYFHGAVADRPSIDAPGGAALSAAVISALTVHGDALQYAADNPAAGAPKAIARIELVKGDASAVRNGEVVVLHAGDLVYKGDAVQTGDGSSLSMTFLDGTAFSLDANARMVLNDMVYDPKSSDNSSLLTLVQGSIGFLAGNVAHTGEMKVDTPVATMGIRGTAVHVEIEAHNGRTHFSVMREHDGRVGRFVLYDHNDQSHVLSTINDVALVVTLELINNVVSISSAPKSPLDISEESALSTVLYEAFQIGQQNPLRIQLGLEPLQSPNQPPNTPPQTPPNGPPNQPHDSGGHGSSTPPQDLVPPSPTPSAPLPGPTAPIQLPQNEPTYTPPTQFASTTGITTAPAGTVAPIDLIGPVSGGAVGVGAQSATINLLAGVNNPAQNIRVLADGAGQPDVSVSVVNGAFNASNLTYTVNSAGLLTLGLSQFSKVAPGTVATLAFAYTLVDSAGAKAAETAVVTIDGGSSVSYGSNGQPIVVGSGPVTVTPTVISPEHGDNFAIDPPGVSLIVQKGQYGIAAINTATGVIVYAPFAQPGVAGIDTFTVSDKDGAGVTTKTNLSFDVDGGTAVAYAQTAAGSSPVVVTPTLISPEGHDTFSFAEGASASLTLKGKYGTAELSSTTGTITYTPTAALGTAGADHFTVFDTDGHGVTTATQATFAVENYVAPAITGTSVGQTTSAELALRPFGGVTITDLNVGASDTLTIALTGGGALSGAGLVGANGKYTLAGSAAAITAELDALLYTPALGAPGTHHTTTFSLTDVSSAIGTKAVDSTTSVIDVDPALAPTISGAQGGQQTTSEATLDPFANVTITDPNAQATDTLTITLTGGGTLSGNGLSSSNGAYTLTGAAADVAAELDALVFTPAVGAPGTQHTTTFTLTDVSSATTATAVDSATSVIDVDPAVAPTISGTQGGQQTTSEATLDPFANVTITDLNAQATDTLTISLTGGGTLSGAGLSGSNGTYTLTSAAADVTAKLDALVFTPAIGAPGTHHTTTFTLTDVSSATTATAVDSTTSVIDVDPAVAPTISGTQGGQQTTSEATLDPFANVTITDLNAQATDTMTITLTGGGTLTGAGLSGSNGTYTLTGAAADVAAELDALVFTPAVGAAGSQHTTKFTLTDVSSATTATAVDSTTSVIDVDPAIAPTISGTQGGQQTTSETTLDPFANVTITDPNAQATDTLTISLTGGGTLSGAGLSGSNGTYTLTSAAADVTAELDALVFTPAIGAPGTHHTTTFTLTDVSSATTATATDSTTSVTDTDPAGPLVLSLLGSTVGLTQAQATLIPGFAVTEAGAPTNDIFTVDLSDTYGHLTATAEGGATVNGAGSAALTIAGSLADVNATLATLTDANYHTGDDAIVITASDSTGRSAGPASLAVHDPGLNLAITAPPSASVEVGATSAIGAISVAEIGAPSDDILTVGVEDAHGVLAMVAQGSARVFTGPSGALEVRGSLADVNATLQTLTDNDPQTGGDTLTISASDSDGNNAKPVDVTISETAQSPTIAAPASAILAEGVASAISGVSIAEIGALAGEGFSVTLSDAHGLLSVVATGLANVSGSGSDHLTISGDLADVNATLLTLADRDNFSGNDTLTAQVTDSLGKSSLTASVSIDNPALSPDVTATGATLFAAQNGIASPIPDLVVSEAGAIAGETFSVTLDDSVGALSVVLQGGAQETVASVSKLTISGDLADLNATLATLEYTAANVTADTIHASVSDSFGNSGGSATIDVHGAATGPILAAPSFVSIAEGVASAIPAIQLSEPGAGSGETFTVTVNDTYGALSVTLQGATRASGNGSTSLSLVGDLADINATLATLTDLDASTGGDKLTIKAADALGVSDSLSINTHSFGQGIYVWSVGSGTWNAASAGDWNPPGNTTTPGAAAIVTIGSGPGGTVTLANSETVYSLSLLEGYSLAAAGYALTLAGELSVSQNSSLSAAALSVADDLYVAGTATISGIATIGGGAEVVQGGQLTLNGGTLESTQLSGAGTFETAPGQSATLNNVAISAGATFVASDGSTTNLSGAIIVDGLLQLDGGINQNGYLNLIGPTTLSGGGDLVMYVDPSYGGTAVVEGAAQTLTIDSGFTIKGVGTIGNGALTIHNSGTIEATPENSSAGLTLNGSGGIVNQGALEAVGGVTLTISAMTVANAGGAITVEDSSSAIAIVNSTIVGGALHNAFGGSLATEGTSTLDGSTSGALTISSGSLIVAGDNSTTNITGAIVDKGTLQLDGGNNQNGYLNLSGATTLSGGGDLVMNINPAYGGSAIVEGAGQTLTVASGFTVEGVGTIGNGALAIDNSGTIEATPENSTAGLTLNGSGGIVNHGTLEAQGGVTLTINGMTVANTGGAITVEDASSAIDIVNATIVGGALNNTFGGTFATQGTSTLDGSTSGPLTISSGSVIIAGDNATTNIMGSIVDKGTLQLDGGNNQNGYLNLIGATTLSGGGELVMSVNPAYGGTAILEGAAQTLTIASGFTVEGVGIIGNGALTLANSGVLEATPEGGSTGLTLNGSGGILNTDLLAAVGGATLTIKGPTVTNAGAAITVEDASSAIVVSGSALIGGTLNNSNGGSFATSAGATLDGLTDGALTISSGSIITAQDGATTNIEGAIVVEGSLQALGGNNQNGSLTLLNATTLSGTGDLVMSVNPAYGGTVYVQGADETLTISSSFTVEGVGVIGGVVANNGFEIENAGVINATPEQTSLALTLNPSQGIVNTGLLSASNGATLTISGSFTVANDHGVIEVEDSASAIVISGAAVVGGTLINAPGGSFSTQNGATLQGTIDDPLTISNGSLITAVNGSTTNIEGVIVDQGSIELLGGNNQNGYLNLIGATSLSGAGDIVLSVNPAYGGTAHLQGADETLTIASSITIEGVGTIGDDLVGHDKLGIVNHGVIEATPEGGSTGLQIVGTGAFANDGTLTAVAGATLTIAVASVANSAGVITVDGSSSAIVKGASIVGGLIEIAAGGKFSTTGGATLDGEASGALTISAGSVVSALNGAETNILGSIIDKGELQLFGGDNQNGYLNLIGATTLSGGGEVVMSVDPAYGGAAILQGAGQTLTVAAGFTIEGVGIIGGSALTLDNSGVIEATPEDASTGLTLNGSGIVNHATLEAANGATLTINGETVTNTGGAIIVEDSSSAIAFVNATVAGGTLDNALGGGLEARGGSTLDGHSSGQLTISAASVLIAENNTTTNMVGAIVDKGTLQLDGGDNTNGYLNLTGATTLSGGGDLVMVVDPAYGGSAILEGAGETLTVASGFTIEGVGIVGNGALTLDNLGTIEATPEHGATGLMLNGSGGILNEGVLSASGGATLTINGAAVTNAGGAITVEDYSSTATIVGATLSGGTLNNFSGGSFKTSAGATLDGLTDGALTISSGSIVVAQDGSTTNIEGSIVIDGVLQGLGGGSQDGHLNLLSATTLSGTGDLIMSVDPAYGGGAYLQGNGETLTISSGVTVEGEGVLGNGSLALVNDGVILATPESGGGGLTLNGSGGIINNGLLEATGGGFLTVSAALTGAGSLAVGASSELELAAASNESVAFGDLGAVFRLDHASTYGGVLENFAVGETLYLAGVNAVSATPTYNGVETTLTVALSGGGSLPFALAGDYSHDSFDVDLSGSDSIIFLVGNPSISAPGAVTETTGTATAIANVGIAEAHAANGQTFSVELADSTGLLSASGAGVSGSGTTNLTITGTLAQVNADLASLTVKEVGANSDTIAINADDGQGSAAAPTYIAVSDPNAPPASAPSLASPTDAFAVVGYATPITGIVLSQTGAQALETFTVTVTADVGLLQAHINTSGGGGTITGSGANELTIVGSLSQVNADLATIKETLGSNAIDQITVAADDSYGQHAATQTIYVSPNTADNWTASGTKDWSVAADWNTGATPGAMDDAAIGIVANPATVTISTAVSVGAIQTLAGTTLDITTGALTIDGADNSEIGGAFLNSGSLTVGADVSVEFAHGASVQLGTAGLGSNDVLTVDGTQTLDNASITYAGYGSAIELDAPFNGAATAPPAKLTLGAHLTLVIDSYGELLDSIGYVGDDVIDNKGTIEVGSAGGLTVEPTSFVNDGSIEVKSGGSIAITPATFTNASSISLSTGATLTIDSQGATGAASNSGTISGDDTTVTFGNYGQFTNTGTLSLTHSTIALYGSFSTAELAVFEARDDAVTINGTLDNSGATLTPGSYTPLVLGSGGAISGGIVQDPGGMAQFQGGTLDNVAWGGVLNVQNGGYVYIDSLTLTGAHGSGSATLGSYAYIYAEGTQTLDNATITYAGYGSTIDLDAPYYGGATAPSATLTLGSHLTLVADSYSEVLGSTGYVGDDVIDNKGTIEVANGGDLTIEPTNFINNGSIEVSNNGSVAIAPTTFTNAGSISLSDGATLTIDYQGNVGTASNSGAISGDDATVTFGNYGQFTNTGTLSLTHSAIALFGSFSTTELAVLEGNDDAVTINGTLHNSGATLTPGSFAPLVLGGGGAISGGAVQDPNGLAQFQDGTLDNVTWEGVLNVQNGGYVHIETNLTLTGMSASNPGSAILGYNATVYFDGTQTLDNATITYAGYGSMIDLDVATGGTGPAPSATLTLGSHLTLVVDSYGESLGSVGYVGDDVIDNKGAIEIGSAGALAIEPTSFVNDGSIEIAGGGQLSISVDYSGNGSLIAQSGSYVTISSTSFVNQGTVSAAGGLIEFGHSVSGSGALEISNLGVLKFDGAQASGETITFEDAAGTLALAAPAAFAATIAGMTAGDAIDLTAIAPSMIASATIVGSSLVIDKSGGGSFALALSAALPGDKLYVYSDGSGGSDVVVGPTTVTAEGWKGVSGDWSGATNWQYGLVPTSAIDAHVALGDDVVVSVTTNAVAHSLVVSAPSAEVDLYGGASLTLTQSLTMNGGAFKLLGGALDASAVTLGSHATLVGTGAVSAPLSNSGSVESTSSLVLAGAVTGTGAFRIDDSASMEFGSSAAGGTVTFATDQGTLQIDQPNQFHAEIGGLFGPDDILELIGLNATGLSATTAGAYDAATGVTTLTVTPAGASAIHFTLVGDYAASTWTATENASNTGVLLVDPPAAASSAAKSADAFVFKSNLSELASSHSGVQPAPATMNGVDASSPHFQAYHALVQAAADAGLGEALADHAPLPDAAHGSSLHEHLFHL